MSGDGGLARPAQLRDVAAEAGVSISTASRVLSGAGRVSAAAQEAVRAASDRLGYRPNRVARALRVQATGSVAMTLPWIRNPFYGELMEAVEQRLAIAGLELFVAQTHGDADEEARRIDTLVERQADGLLVIPCERARSAPALRRALGSVPVVQIERRVDDLAADYVGVDNLTGIRLVVDHLVAGGCRRIGLVSGPWSSSTGRSRYDGFVAAMAAHPDVEVVEPVLDLFTWQAGARGVQHLHDRGTVPEGLVCGSDLVALGALRELARLGHRVPDEVRVTGFDDMLFSELSDPPLTTVHQPVEAIAEAAVDRLVTRLAGGDPPPVALELEPTLEVRRSSMPVAAITT
jgi:LacI family transcriptional regulator